MRKVLLALAASLAVASPALANEGRVEARGGVIWGGGSSDAIAGVAAGYDWDLGSSLFGGIEVSGDKVLDGFYNRVSLGAGARLGVKTSDAGKLYVAGSYQSKFCSFCKDGISAGAGYQHKLGTNLYGKLEYRHIFYDNGVIDGNTAGVGIGMTF